MILTCPHPNLPKGGGLTRLINDSFLPDPGENQTNPLPFLNICIHESKINTGGSCVSNYPCHDFVCLSVGARQASDHSRR
ncbi:hypothetical protein SBA2_380005 [Acidobacteriia bacterium SbA2]|nr:hypothetical protein SBA2_380005 [Acidobacteriia bacterium SbA2]